MLNWIKNKLKGKSEEPLSEYSFRWYEAADVENPFNKRILDIRSFTQTVVATTTQQSIAETFSLTRSSLGENHIGQTIKGEQVTEANLVYPHNGESLEGVVFKAPEMEAKWDIYIYDNCFYFVRSWSDELFLKAYAEVLADKIVINKIAFSAKTYTSNEALNAIHFLIKSHALGQPFPHLVPKFTEDEMKIASLSFSLYGNYACYATFEDILDTVIKK